ncbi:MAG: hypothetical protein Q9159_001703 [Coniocarpon cinnabarinum]
MIPESARSVQNSKITLADFISDSAKLAKLAEVELLKSAPIGFGAVARRAFSDVFQNSTDIKKARKQGDDLRRAWLKPLRCQDTLRLLQLTVEELRKLRIHDEHPPDRLASDNLHAYHLSLVAHERYQNAVAFVIYVASLRFFGLRETARESVRGLPRDAESVRKSLSYLLRALDEVGLGGDRVGRAWAVAMEKLIDAWVLQFKVSSEEESLAERITHFVKDSLVPWSTSWTRIDAQAVALLNEQAMSMMGHRAAVGLFKDLSNPWTTTRATKPFNDFLKQYLTTPKSRDNLASTFENLLWSRILHADVSTVSILSIYIRLIRTFRDLDPSGVVLRRLASPLQSYLSLRPDAVRIVLLSLLESSRDGQDNLKRDRKDFCAGIAACLDDDIGHQYREYYEGMDLTDTNWMPEPIDAPQGHQEHRSLDPIAHVVGISSRTDFLSELQTVLSTRLLSSASRGVENFTPEITLLQLFQTRFEELHIQACEIMVRDVLTSQLLSRNLLNHLDAGSAPDWNSPGLLVISQHYWDLNLDASSDFDVPARIAKWQEGYNAVFGRVQPGRKLEFLNHLGAVTLCVEQGGRETEVECNTVQATLIQLFDGATAWSVKEMMAACGMGLEMVTREIEFWVRKGVLTCVPGETVEENVYHEAGMGDS